jgi:hypothetical protein
MYPAGIPQRHRLRSEPLELQPPQVIDQQVGVDAVGAALAGAQKPIRRPVHLSARQDDGVRSATVASYYFLNPDIPDDQPTSHASPDVLLTSRTFRPRSVKADAIPHRG